MKTDGYKDHSTKSFLLDRNHNALAGRPRSIELPPDLNSFACEIELPPKALVFSEGDPGDAVFAVGSGRLKLVSTSRGGRAAILRFSGPGDLLGLSAVLNHSPHQVTAETMERTRLKKVLREDFLHCIRRSPELGFRAAETLARQYNELLVDARRMALSTTVAARLARFLLECDAEAMRGAQGFAPASFTHEEIASITGTTRETVTRLLNRFERDGIIRRRDSTLLIADRETLQRVAG